MSIEGMNDPEWWEFHNNLALLYAWLDDRDAAPEVVEFLEKPWKWTPEWEQRRSELIARTNAPHERTAREDIDAVIAAEADLD